MIVNFIKVFVLLILIATSCTNKQEIKNVDVKGISKKIDNGNFVKFSKQTYLEIINSTPSPTKLTPQLEQFNVPYYKNLPLDFENKMLKYDIQQQAFLQGLFSVDLSYQNLYKKSFVSLSYYNSVKLLAANIGIDEFYNTESFKKFVANKNNSDSLLSLTLNDFINVINHFEEINNQDNLSMFITFGAWLESLYLLSEISQKKENEFFTKELLIQKYNIEKFISVFENLPPTYFNQLIIKELKKIKEAINKLEYNIILKEIAMKKINNDFFITHKFEVNEDIKTSELKELQQQINIARTKLITKF